MKHAHTVRQLNHELAKVALAVHGAWATETPVATTEAQVVALRAISEKLTKLEQDLCEAESYQGCLNANRSLILRRGIRLVEEALKATANVSIVDIDDRLTLVGLKVVDRHLRQALNTRMTLRIHNLSEKEP